MPTPNPTCRPRLALRLTLGLWAAILLSGCGGPKTAEVSGTVTFNGKALPRGSIGFVADDGRVESGPIIDGKYQVARAPVGHVRVTVTGGPRGQESMGPPQRKMGVMKLGEGVEKGEPLANTKAAKEPTMVVPRKYNKAETSDLAYEVKDGSQQKDFALTP